jgi:hypothetical protein
MAVQVKAAGDGPNTGMLKTPPPVKPAAPDEITEVRRPTRAGYGMNGFSGRSSTSPGETVLSPLAENLKASQDDGEGLLDRIARLGVAKHGDDVDLQSPQTRNPGTRDGVSQEQYPATFGMRNRNDPAKAVKIPSVTGHSPMADEARRRQAALQRADGTK